jgi:hypothetical protein
LYQAEQRSNPWRTRSIEKVKREREREREGERDRKTDKQRVPESEGCTKRNNVQTRGGPETSQRCVHTHTQTHTQTHTHTQKERERVRDRERQKDRHKEHLNLRVVPGRVTLKLVADQKHRKGAEREREREREREGGRGREREREGEREGEREREGGHKTVPESEGCTKRNNAQTRGGPETSQRCAREGNQAPGWSLEVWVRRRMSE